MAWGEVAAELAAELDQLVADWDRPDLPGGAIAILRDGEPARVRTFGMADLEEQRAMDRDTPFYLASLAKPFTAAFAPHAARAGQLDLDASLRDVFPNLPACIAGQMRYRSAATRGAARWSGMLVVPGVGSYPVRTHDEQGEGRDEHRGEPDSMQGAFSEGPDEDQRNGEEECTGDQED